MGVREVGGRWGGRWGGRDWGEVRGAGWGGGVFTGLHARVDSRADIESDPSVCVGPGISKAIDRSVSPWAEVADVGTGIEPADPYLGLQQQCTGPLQPRTSCPPCVYQYPGHSQPPTHPPTVLLALV